MATKNFLAADLGASNGRTILGEFNGQRITINEINRFSNSYIRVDEAYFWDILGLYSNIISGICLCRKKGAALSGIGIDTWGVDFGLIDSKGRLIGNPRAYRDPRGQRGMKAFVEKYGEKTAFDITGIANWEYNTLFQLYDMIISGDPQLSIAYKMLLLPDLLGYMLCGSISSEYTHATTTQMLNKQNRTWSKEIIKMIGLPDSMLAPVQTSGTVKGYLTAQLKEQTGQKCETPVFCVGSHDTASAVASLPVRESDYAFISSGTWSLIGIVSKTAIVNDTVFDKKLSNEGTVDGKYRLLQNIMGLWIIQCCKKQWDREEPLSWDDIIDLSKNAPEFKSFIDVNDHLFFDGDDMIRKIQAYCKTTDQPVPTSKGEIARAVYESLAMSYREAFESLEILKGRRINVMHIVGGGSKNLLLNQFAANATGRETIAGPAEATAIGNLMVQVMASGEVADMSEVRQVIRDSFKVLSFEPKETNKWNEHYCRFLKIKRLYKEANNLCSD